jgi:hypothetical protein
MSFLKFKFGASYILYSYMLYAPEFGVSTIIVNSPGGASVNGAIIIPFISHYEIKYLVET